MSDITAKKPNELISGKYSDRWDSYSYRTLFGICRKISNGDDAYRPIKIPVEWVIGVNEGDYRKMGGYQYSQLAEHFGPGSEKVDKFSALHMDSRQDGVWKRVNLFSSIEYDPMKPENVSVSLTTEAVSIFDRMLTKGYTRLSLLYLTKFRSQYAMRIYELLKQYQKIGERPAGCSEDHSKYISINEFREMIGVPEGSYTKFNQLKFKVIEAAQKFIKDKTDIVFEYEETRENKKTVGIRFTKIEKNEAAAEFQRPMLSLDTELSDAEAGKKYYDSRAETLLKPIWSKKFKVKLLSTKGLEYVEFYYARARAAEKTGKIRNFDNLYFSMLKNDPLHFVEEQAEEEVRAIKRKIKEEQLEKAKLEDEKKREIEKRSEEELIKEFVSQWNELGDAIKSPYIERLSKFNADMYKTDMENGVFDGLATEILASMYAYDVEEITIKTKGIPEAEVLKE